MQRGREDPSASYRSMRGVEGWDWDRDKKKTHVVELLLKCLLLDWIVILALGVLQVVVYKLFPPYRRQVLSGDLTVQYPKLHESVPVALLFLLAVVLPVLVFLAFWSVSMSKKLRINDLIHSITGLGKSLMFASALTMIMKFLAGRPRPNYMSLCELVDGVCKVFLSFFIDSDSS